MIAIHDICQDGPIWYLVLEFVAGGSASTIGSMKTRLALLEATQVMIERAGSARMPRDWCIAISSRPISCAAPTARSRSRLRAREGTGEGARHFTQTGMVVGALFMSPEQCETGRPTIAATSIPWEATYYCLLTGSCPYQSSESIPQLMFAHCHAPVPDPRAIDPSLPEAVTRIIAFAMAKAPADRYQNASAMIADLQAVVAAMSGQPKIALPSESAVAAAVAVARAECLQQQPSSNKRMYAVMFGVLMVALLSMVSPSGGRGKRPRSAALFRKREPVNVGVLHSMSGTMQASESPVVDAVLFAIEINASGGVLGRR